MADEKVMKLAKSVYEGFCTMLDNNDWHYDRHDDDLTITCGARGEDLPMEFIIMVNTAAQVVSVYSMMPTKMPEDKRVEGAIAVAMANHGMVNGHFDYDVSDGSILYKMVTSFRGSLLAEEVYHYMIMLSASIVDDYNDKFLMISKGMMTLEQFAAWEQEQKNG